MYVFVARCTPKILINIFSKKKTHEIFFYVTIFFEQIYVLLFCRYDHTFETIQNTKNGYTFFVVS